jgi:hypothetical protein
MASCDTLAQADKAVDAGWRAAVTITSHKAPGARKPQLRKTARVERPRYTQTPKKRRIVSMPSTGRTNAIAIHVDYVTLQTTTESPS